MVPVWILLATLSVAQVSTVDAPAHPDTPIRLETLPILEPPVEAAAFMSGASDSAIAVQPTFEMSPQEPAGATPCGLTMAMLSPHGSAGLGITDLGLNRTWCWSAPKPIFITGSLGAHFFDGPTAIDMPASVYDIYMDLSTRLIERESGGISVGITPGLFGDFKNLANESFQVTGRVVGDYRVSPQLVLIGGVAVVRQLRSRWLPIGGAIWTPNADWQIDITIPRPRIARRLWQTDEVDLWGYFAGQFGGGSWAVQDEFGNNVLLGYSDLRLLAGVNIWRSSGRELSCEFGYVFGRDVFVSETSVFVPSDTWTAQLALAF